jgi:hypothetical protein
VFFWNPALNRSKQQQELHFMSFRRFLGLGLLGIMLATPLVISAQTEAAQKKGGKRKSGKKRGKKGPVSKKGEEANRPAVRAVTLRASLP